MASLAAVALAAAVTQGATADDRERGDLPCRDRHSTWELLVEPPLPLVASAWAACEPLYSFRSDANGRQCSLNVIAKAGANLGGSDIDQWIVEYFGKTQGTQASVVVKRLAERLKIALSRQIQADEVYFDDQTFTSYEMNLNRDTLEKILRENGFFDQLDSAMMTLLQQ